MMRGDPSRGALEDTFHSALINSVSSDEYLAQVQLGRWFAAQELQLAAFSGSAGSERSPLVIIVENADSCSPAMLQVGTGYIVKI